ncbi:MAG: DNA-processing protein DprA [Bacillota bacterium]|jgi:DNA processing protein
MGEVAEWIALNDVPNLGPRRIAAVFRETGGIDSFLAGDFARLADILHVKVETIRNILGALDLERGREMTRLCRNRGIGIVTLQCPDYPSLLREIYDPPPVLYYLGALPGPRPLLAAVGSRKATRYGRSVTAALIPPLCRAGLGVVSGLAAGIDSSAHWASLKEGGYTLAVLGNGVDVFYPAANRELQGRIVDSGGCLLSEFPPGARPRANHFPRRNRVISGLCQGLLVVEAGIKSGAMITVGFALEQGRDVYSVPGNIDSPQSGGTNHLIRMGAKPVLSSRDILEEYGLDLPLAGAPVQAAAALDREEQALLAQIDAQGTSVDDLCYLTGLPGSVVLARLVALELKGAVARLPGQKFVRCTGSEV